MAFQTIVRVRRVTFRVNFAFSKMGEVEMRCLTYTAPVCARVVKHDRSIVDDARSGAV